MKRPAFITLILLVSGRICGTFLNIPGWFFFFAVLALSAGVIYYLSKSFFHNRTTIEMRLHVRDPGMMVDSQCGLFFPEGDRYEFHT